MTTLTINKLVGNLSSSYIEIGSRIIAVNNLIQKEKQKSDGIIPIVIVLGECSEKVANSLINDLEELSKVKDPIQQIRFID